ncbi:MAG: hypothetical protein HY257_04665 [Chloroflexi bacterium]|nr:hypothetical protein [Chloroflexota bacterium]
MQAKEQGAQIAEVIDRESGKTYRATIARIWKNGFSVNRGHGAQMALALTEWNHDDEPIQGRLF